MRHRHLAIVPTVAFILLAGCSLFPGAIAGGIDGEWVMTAGTNQGQAIPMVAGAKITLTVDGTQVGGSAACNSYGGKLVLNGASITITELFQTEMACVDDNVMASEAAYLAALAVVTTAARDGSSLILTGPQVELQFTLTPPLPDAALAGPVWTLESLISGEAVSSTAAQATLQFLPDGKLTASTGCRTVTGSYTVSESHVDVTLDPYDTIGCANDVGGQDAQVLAVLSNGFDVVIQGNSLTLSAGGTGLTYRVAAGS